MPAEAANGSHDPVAIARRFLQSMAASGPLIVAVSGGGDSMTLLNALDAANREAPDCRRELVAATVDHGLRLGSAAEVRQVAQFCAGRGLRHESLAWQGAKPASGVQAAARMARYRLLAGLAREVKAAGVVTAHTLDDQVETVAMRAGRSDRSGAPGLAGMAAATLFDRSCWILRPFLGVRREELRHWLVDRAIAWIEDPSNDDRRFERVRLRQDDGCMGETAARIGGWQDERRRVNEAVARVLAGRAKCHGGVLAVLEGELDHGDDPAVHAAVSLLMAISGGRAHRPGEETLRRLAAFLRLRADGRFSASRSIVERRRERLFLFRERRNLPVGRLAAGERYLYDGRYGLQASARSVEIAHADDEMIGNAGNLPEFSGLPPGVVRQALAAEPVLHSDGRRSFVWRKAESGLEVGRHLAPFDVFLPLFDHTLAQACAALYGEPPYPPPPLRA